MLRSVSDMNPWLGALTACAIALAAAFCLSGCGLSAAIGGTGAAGGLLGQAENLVPELVLQKYQALHNLKVGMEAIDASPGAVTMITPAPRIVPAR
jgi:hypothetical protein